jgi:hypothetical protein
MIAGALIEARCRGTLFYHQTAEYINDHVLPKSLWWKPSNSDKLKLNI